MATAFLMGFYFIARAQGLDLALAESIAFGVILFFVVVMDIASLPEGKK